MEERSGGAEELAGEFLTSSSVLAGAPALPEVSGIVAGPIIGAFFVAVWQMFEDEYAREIENR